MKAQDVFYNDERHDYNKHSYLCEIESRADAELFAHASILRDLVQRAAFFLELNGTARVALVEDCKSAIASTKGGIQ